MGATCKVHRVDVHAFEGAQDDFIALADLLCLDPVGVARLGVMWDALLWVVSVERRERPHMMPDPDLPETQAIFPSGFLPLAGARYALPHQVGPIASALAAVDADALRPLFRPGVMRDAEVYPGRWGDESEAWSDLLGKLARLRQLYTAAAEAGQVVISVVD